MNKAADKFTVHIINNYMQFWIISRFFSHGWDFMATRYWRMSQWSQSYGILHALSLNLKRVQYFSMQFKFASLQVQKLVNNDEHLRTVYPAAA